MKKIIVLMLASLSLMTGLVGAAQASPGRTTSAPPPVPASVRNAQLSGLMRKLAALHLKRGKRLSARELKALGLRPDPKSLAARSKRLTKSTRARAAAGMGSTYWFTYRYAGQLSADVWYDGPYVDVTTGTTTYTVYNNYRMDNYAGNETINLGVYTYVYNIDILGTYYYVGPAGTEFSNPDSAGLPLYGYGPFFD